MKKLFHQKAIDIIKATQKRQWGNMSNARSPLNGIKALLNFKDKKFGIMFHGGSMRHRAGIDIGKYYKKILFASAHTEVEFKSVYLSHQGKDTRGSVDFFYSKGYSENRQFFYRLLLPLGKDYNFLYQIENIVISTDLGWQTSHATQLQIGEAEMVICIVHDKEKNYFLSIESNKRHNYKEFSGTAYGCLNSIGYVTGFLPGDGGYFFCYTTAIMNEPLHFYYCTFRPTIKTSYRPIHTNPFAYLSAKRKLADRYFKKELLKPISRVQLSNLAEKLIGDINLTGAIILILESSVASLMFMPGGFAIALETLSDIIIGDDKEKLAPIPSPALSKIIRKECNDVINKHKDSLTEEGRKTLLSKIEHINQMPNKARLQAPFKKLGIVLNDSDLLVLDSRNDFLHGRTPDFTGAGYARSLDREIKDMYYAAMRFYTLLSMLILKWAGYDNYVLNFPKIYEDYCKVKLAEPYYREV